MKFVICFTLLSRLSVLINARDIKDGLYDAKQRRYDHRNRSKPDFTLFIPSKSSPGAINSFKDDCLDESAHCKFFDHDIKAEAPLLSLQTGVQLMRLFDFRDEIADSYQLPVADLIWDSKAR